VTLDLAGPVPDPLDTRVAPESLQRQIRHQPHTAVHLYGFVGDAGEHFRSVELGLGNLSVRIQALIQPPRAEKRQPVGGVDLGDHVGELEGHPLELADGLSELLALGGPAQGEIEYAPRATHAVGGDGEPGGVEPLIHHLETAVHLAEDLRRRQAAVVEAQDTVVISAVGDRPVSFADFEPRNAAIHQQAGDAFLRAAGRGLLPGRHEYDDEIGDVRVADEMLGAVDDEIVAVAARKGLHAADIGPRVRLGHGQRVQFLTLDAGRQVTLALLVVAGA